MAPQEFGATGPSPRLQTRRRVHEFGPFDFGVSAKSKAFRLFGKGAAYYQASAATAMVFPKA